VRPPQYTPTPASGDLNSQPEFSARTPVRCAYQRCRSSCSVKSARWHLISSRMSPWCGSYRSPSLYQLWSLFAGLSFGTYGTFSVSALIGLETLTFDLSTSKRGHGSPASWAYFLPIFVYVLPFSTYCQARDRQTDRETDRETDRPTTAINGLSPTLWGHNNNQISTAAYGHNFRGGTAIAISVLYMLNTWQLMFTDRWYGLDTDFITSWFCNFSTAKVNKKGFKMIYIAPCV